MAPHTPLRPRWRTSLSFLERLDGINSKWNFSSAEWCYCANGRKFRSRRQCLCIVSVRLPIARPSWRSHLRTPSWNLLLGLKKDRLHTRLYWHSDDSLSCWNSGLFRWPKVLWPSSSLLRPRGKSNLGEHRVDSTTRRSRGLNTSNKQQVEQYLKLLHKKLAAHNIIPRCQKLRAPAKSRDLKKPG